MTKVRACVVNRKMQRQKGARAVSVRTLAVTAGLLLLVSVGAWGCAEAGESVSGGADRVTARATPTSPLAAPSSARASATALSSASSAPTVAAPVTSGGGSGPSGGAVAASAAPPNTGVIVAPTVAVTTGPTGVTAAAVPVPVAFGEVSLSSVACGGHDDGDWVVFGLDGTALNATAGYGASPVAVAGERTVVVTLAPTFDRVTSPPTYRGCRHVTDIQRASTDSGSASWVIGVRGEPRITVVGPGPAGDGFAYVVKLQA